MNFQKQANVTVVSSPLAYRVGKHPVEPCLPIAYMHDITPMFSRSPLLGIAIAFYRRLEVFRG